MITRVLTPDDDALLADERACLSRLQRALARADADAADQDALAQSVRRLDELFLLVVVGEFNSGKSTFINALIGQRVLEEGATPTTRRVHVLVHGPAVAQVSSTASVDTIAAPVEMLREIHIVDTPGTNAIFREHEAITTDFVPRADFVLFVTSADRPFTETERGFLEVIREWGKKIVIVINKVDILETAADLDSVLSVRAAERVGAARASSPRSSRCRPASRFAPSCRASRRRVPSRSARSSSSSRRRSTNASACG